MVKYNFFCKKGYLLWSFLILYGISVCGQSKYSIVNYPEFKGIDIGAIQSDEFGRLWVSTQSGLVLFDGYELKRFHPNSLDSNTIGSLNTYGMYQDNQNHLWIGINRDVSRYIPRTRTFKNYINPFASDYPENSIVGVGAINALSTGEVFLGLSGTYSFRPTQCLYYVDLSSDSLSQLTLPKEYNIRNVFRIEKGLDGELLLITNEGIFRINVDKELDFPLEYNNLINKTNEFFNGIHLDNDQNLWFTTSNKKLIKIDSEHRENHVYNITGIEEYPTKILRNCFYFW